jgi:hypothetical protein
MVKPFVGKESRVSVPNGATLISIGGGILAKFLEQCQESHAALGRLSS